MEKSFRHITFRERLSSALRVDLRRMFTTPLIYILVGACLIMPVVILVMTTMMDGSVSVDPQTGAETVIEGFDNVWQIIGSVSNAPADAAGGMSITSMCNINMLYFFIAVLVCLFVGADFKSGYSKNLFTVRAKKSDYAVSKLIVCTLGGILMILAFFVGSMLGGVISDLSFDMVGFGTGELVMCIISKMLLVGLFVPIYFVMSTVTKSRVWMSLVLSFAVGMFLFMMIPMLSPLDASPVGVLLCGGGAVLLSAGLGAVGVTVLNKTSLV